MHRKHICRVVLDHLALRANQPEVCQLLLASPQSRTASTIGIGGDRNPLDLIAALEGYVLWRERAIDHLAKGRLDIQQLLRWAESR